MKATPPIRFLALVLGGWVLARTFVLAPDWSGAPTAAGPPVSSMAATHPDRAATAMPAMLAPVPAPEAPAGLGGSRPLIRLASYKNLPIEAASSEQRDLGAGPAPPNPDIASTPRFDPPPAPTQLPIPASTRPAARWSGSAWILARNEGGAPALAPGGTLGGSQAGARLLYRLDGRLALSGRLYAPLRRPGGAEAAAGLDWQPAPRLPLHLLVERRQALAGEGRSAFAITLYGGGGRDLPGGFRLDAYGQAGVVGIRSRDLFVDGGARLSLAAGPAQIGGGAWGAAQPGAARLDIGPQASIRLPVRGGSIRLEADWRFRIAGEAAPGSGPALILAADY